MKYVALAVAPLILISSFALIAAEVDLSKLPSPSARTGLTFDKDIKPVFAKSCVECHSGEKPKARLRLDTLENTLKGGGDGKVLEVGNSAKSLLVVSIARIGDEDEWMPPKDNKAGIAALTAEEVGLIRAWIDQGAK
jgi:uncharacterized membrane protein